MKARNDGLVPTVITNKRGVLTTVYRRPGKTTPPSRARVPDANEKDREFYLLRKQIAQRLSQPDMQHWEHAWRKRILASANETQDLAMLRHLKKHFAVHGPSFETTVEVMDAAGLDRSDESLFDTVVRFTDFASHSHPPVGTIVELLPLVLAHPEKIEVIAHYANLTYRRDESITLEGATAYLKHTEPSTTVLPEFLAVTVTPSTTPVTDRRIVSDATTSQEQWYAYHHFHGFDEQVITYMAAAVRENVMSPELWRSIKNQNMSARATVELLALLKDNKDLIGPHGKGFEAELRGPNGSYFTHSLDRLRAVRPDFHEDWSTALGITTPEELAAQSALFRFTLTVEDNAAQNLQRVLEEPVDSEGQIISPYDDDLVNLIRRYSSKSEVGMLVDLFNERGVTDVEFAEEYLKAQSSPALAKGWL